MSEPHSPIGKAPSLDDLALLAEAAFAGLPEGFRELAGDVIFRVDDFPSEEVLDELGIEDPFGLTGLYQGVDIGHRDSIGPASGPSMIFLYRVPILAEWAETGAELGELVSHVIVHEIGHHFGLSDDDMERAEEDAD